MIKQTLGIMAALLCLFGMTAGSIYLPTISYDQKELQNEGFAPPLPTSNPKLMTDQLKVHGISEIARALPEDHEYLLKRYNALPPMRPRTSEHVSEEDLARYNGVYRSVVNEFKEFKKRNMGDTPGVFRVFALVGMIDPFLENAKLRGFISQGIREEEFDWIRIQVMTAGAYCVDYKLKHEKLTQQQTQRLNELLTGMFNAALITAPPEPGMDPVFNPDKWKPDQIPRHNIELFLDHSKNIEYEKVHPRDVDFDKAAIMAAAANNPP